MEMSQLTVSPEAIAIPAQFFYSAHLGLQKKGRASLEENGKKSPTASSFLRTKRQTVQSQYSINTSKGVKHKIRRRHESSNTRSGHSLGIDSLLCNIRNEDLRNRIETKRVEKQQIQEVHDILRKSQNPIALARPLRALHMSDDSNNNNVDGKNGLSHELSDTTVETEFSDCDNTVDENLKDFPLKMTNDSDNILQSSTQQENVENTSISTSRPQTPNENRKFFKSGHTSGIPKEVKITENIKALVCNGKITLVAEKRKPRSRSNTAADFSVAQAAVDVIIQNLDDHSELDSTETLLSVVEKRNHYQKSTDGNDELSSGIEFLESTASSDYRKRIPYKTDDPTRIEEQHFLLDFLTTHDICNEENFKIFIAEPEKHKDQAMKIVNEVLAVDDDDYFRDRIPFNTQDPKVIEKQKRFLEFLSSHNLLNEENFDIFITNSEKRRSEANNILANVLSKSNEVANAEQNSNCTDKLQSDDISDTSSASKESLQPSAATEMHASTHTNLQNLFPIFHPGHCQPLLKKFTRPSRNWKGGHGLSQYQIDAGQKEFGAKQCKQCGLVYGVHEPEEEKLHRDFHASLHVLRFKGWIDEDRVADYPEWGRDGRIIRITESASAKRRERLNEILKIVDKELGFSSYIIPKTYVAFLAVRNCLIVGFCLVQPLDKANKYIRSNGVDCCTVEEFPAKCGVSRIWVAPLHRRMHIAKKLLQAVQMNTIVGEEIPLHKIAFSAPTEDGKCFAQKIMETESFLVYQ